jgi:nitrite reductase (NADH) large subunit
VKYVIVGNGVAGTAAALQIRRHDQEGEIAMVSDEALPFYSRIRLIEYLAGEIDEEELIVHKGDWYEKNRIRLLLETPATGIDAVKQEVLIKSGERLGYDRLLISTGGLPFVLPIPGAEKEGVFTLRTVQDARAIRDYADRVDDVVLIGGGVLGLETGNALRKRGKRILVVEVFPRLLPRQMDPEGSEVLRDQMEGMGFRFFLGAKTEEILGGGKAEAVLLEDGRRITAGMVVISAGIKADTALAEGTGIKLGKRGILVDDMMRTSVENVYAAGDNVEHGGVLYGIWPAAESQGQVTGVNMAGGTDRFSGITPSNILKVAGVDLVSAGNIDAEGKCDCIVQKDNERHIYRKVVIEEGSLRGCILLGPLEGRRKLLRAIEEKRPLGPIKEELEKWDLRAL